MNTEHRTSSPALEMMPGFSSCPHYDHEIPAKCKQRSTSACLCGRWSQHAVISCQRHVNQNHCHPHHRRKSSSHFLFSCASLMPVSVLVTATVLLLLCNNPLTINGVSAESLGKTGCNRVEESDRSVITCRIRSLNSLTQTLVPQTLRQQGNRPVSLSITCQDHKSASSFSLNSINSSSPATTTTATHVHNNLNEVKDLRIERCKISEIPANVFNPVPSLTNLTIRTLFSPDPWSQSVYLEDETIPGMVMSSGSLSQLQSLQSLDLGFNGMSSLPNGIFCLLTHLKVLNVTNNRLTSFDSLGLVDPTTGYLCLQQLKVLDFSHNKIRFLSETGVASLKNLQALYLHHNLLTQVAELSLSSLSQLSLIDLSHNKLTSVPPRLFRDSADLSHLMLNHNNIQHLPHGVFDDAQSLREIHVQENLLSDINGLFMNLPNLRVLNVSRNRISWFDYALIPVGLHQLDMRGNHIESLSNYYNTILRLRQLHVSHNKIQEIDSQSFPDSINIIDMSHNNLKKIAAFTFMGKSNLTRVDLRNNRLHTIDMNSFQLSKTRAPEAHPSVMRSTHTKQLPDFYLSDNPYSCDCNMEWLRNILTLDESGQYPRFVDADQVSCLLSFRKQKPVMIPLNKVNSTSFLCQYKSHCFALCHCCDFDACDCEMSCPDNCNCYYDQGWNNNIVDCSASNSYIHRMIPPRIPMDVTELYLDNNQIHTLASHTFIGRRNLRYLHMNNSGIHNISNHSFNGLKGLQLLNLNHNHLTALRGFEFEPLFELKELYLSFNKISVIANKTFNSMKNLRVLHLDHNYIYQFQIWQLTSNTRLQEVRLAHNSWSCECSFLKQLTPWLQEKKSVISDADIIQCFDNSSTAMTLLASNFNVYLSCSSPVPPVQTTPDPSQRTFIPEYIPVLALITSTSLIIVIAVIVIVIYRREVNFWFFSRFGFRIPRRSTATREDEKLFDCFVSYSKMDEAFVTQILAPELEYGNPSYRICLHYRDLPVVSGYLSPDAIIEAMEASRRSILVISENFLKNEWCRYSFKSAHLEVLRSNIHHKLILIFVGKFNENDFDPDIRFWLRRSTILHWNEKMFWEKLRYAMPDVSSRKSFPESSREMTIAHI